MNTPMRKWLQTKIRKKVSFLIVQSFYENKPKWQNQISIQHPAEPKQKQGGKKVEYGH